MSGVASVAGGRCGDWCLLAPAEQAEWEEGWLARDGAGRGGVLYLLPEAPPVEPVRFAAVWHPALARLVAWGDRPRPWLARARIAGRPLTAYLLSGPAPQALAVSIAAQAGAGLAALHAQGLAHGLVSDARVVVESIREPRVRLVGQGLGGARWRGGLDHAAPETMRGAPLAPAADVYGLGLLLWQLLTGRLPWAELGRSQALLRRSREVPPLEHLPRALAELAGACLALDPGARPQAREVVEALRAQGAVLAAPALRDVARQVRSQPVVHPAAGREAERWLAEGGRLAVRGPAGSGRSRFLDGLAAALGARQAPFVRLAPGARAWDPVELALSSPGLSGTPVPLPELPEESRAPAAARALLGRSPAGFALLVDDLEGLDGPSAAVLGLLAAEPGMRIAAACTVAPSWAERAFDLGPWTREQVGRWLRAALGEVEGLEVLSGQLWTVAGGLPGATIARLLGLVRAGALRWDLLAWRLDPALAAAALGRSPAPDADGTEISAEARLLAGFLACAGGPATLEYLCLLASVPEERGWEALEELVDAGWVRVEHRQVLPHDRAAREQMARACGDTAAVHRRLLAQALDLPEPDAARVGWHVVGARAADLAPRFGRRAVEAASFRHAPDGVALAEALWDLAPQRALAAARVVALARAGRTAEAVAIGERAEAEARGTPDAGALCAALAEALAGDPTRIDEALVLVRAAREHAGVDAGVLHDLEARLCLARGDLDDAERAARRVSESPPPEAPWDLDRWLALRAVWARALQRRGRLEEAIRVLDVLPTELGRDRPARAALDGVLGALLHGAGRLAEAAEAMERGCRRDRGLPPVERARLLREVGATRRALGNREQALAAWREALELLERAGEDQTALDVLLDLAAGLSELRRAEEAQAAARLAVARGAALGRPAARVRAAAILADLALESGDWPEAERWLQRGEEEAQADAGALAVLARGRAELALRRRDGSAAAVVCEALRLAEAAGCGIGRARALLVCSDARGGARDRLDEAVAACIEPLRRAGDALELAEARLWLAEALLCAGRLADAEQEAARALLFAEEVGHVRIQAHARALVARARRTLADDPEAQQLARLLDLSVALVRERDPARLLERIARAALDLLEAGRAFVLVERKGELQIGAALALDGQDPGRPSGSILRRVLGDGREVIAADLAERADLRDAISIVDLDLGSALCVPMAEDDRILGAIYVDSRRASALDPANAARLLRALAAHASVAVGNARRLDGLVARAAEAAEIAHDLRSPAASISILAAELAEQLPEGHRGRGRVQRIADAAQRIRDIAGSLAEADPAGGGPQDLAEVVAAAVAMEEPAARRAGVQLAVHLEPGLVVIGRALALSRVVSNLLVNAVRHSPVGGVVDVVLAEARGAAVCSVRDRGAGIPAGEEERIFLRGVQGEGRRGQQGLGLAIAQRIVEAHGGRITARSHAEGGAEVSFSIPLRRG